LLRAKSVLFVDNCESQVFEFYRFINERAQLRGRCFA
jgi:hypothetical protein